MQYAKRFIKIYLKRKKHRLTIVTDYFSNLSPILQFNPKESIESSR